MRIPKEANGGRKRDVRYIQCTIYTNHLRHETRVQFISCKDVSKKLNMAGQDILRPILDIANDLIIKATYIFLDMLGT